MTFFNGLIFTVHDIVRYDPLISYDSSFIRLICTKSTQHLNKWWHVMPFHIVVWETSLYLYYLWPRICETCMQIILIFTYYTNAWKENYNYLLSTTYISNFFLNVVNFFSDMLSSNNFFLFKGGKLHLVLQWKCSRWNPFEIGLYRA